MVQHDEAAARRCFRGRDRHRRRHSGHHQDEVDERALLYWAPVLEAIIENYAEPLSTAALAEKVSLSVSQFDRRFQQRFLTTPRKYVMNVRIDAACQLLASTELPIATIALQTGFYDQSHFTNYFSRSKGISPAQYRRKYGSSQH